MATLSHILYNSPCRLLLSCHLILPKKNLHSLWTSELVAAWCKLYCLQAHYLAAHAVQRCYLQCWKGTNDYAHQLSGMLPLQSILFQRSLDTRYLFFVSCNADVLFTTVFNSVWRSSLFTWKKHKRLTLKTVASNFREIRTLLFIGVTPYVNVYMEAERSFNMVKPVVMKTIRVTWDIEWDYDFFLPQYCPQSDE